MGAAREAGREGGVVRAAGGVVVRPASDEVEVLLVHRPRYDDCTFPNGKAHPGESDADCALREVEEETRLQCELVRELPSTSYVDGRGRPKRVRYWLMTPTGEAGPANEVDAVHWASRDEAARLLTYGRDLPVLEAV
jgi:8-oxo-dGTP pyrophosphatase MutT (NUDIX family)